MRIYIPTRGRLDKQITLRSIPDSLRPITWLMCREDEADALRDRYGVNVATVPARPKYRIAQKRQAIMVHAARDGVERVLMLDDDFVFLKKGLKKDPAAKTPYSMYNQTGDDFFDMVADVAEALRDYAVVTCAERNRCHTYVPDKKGRAYNTRVNGFIACRPSIILNEGFRWDELDIMEDFNMMLNLYRAGYESAVLCDWIWGQRGVSGAAGGCSTYRDQAVQAKAVNALKALHEDFVRVVEKETKGGWFGGKRLDCQMYWKKALASAPSIIKPERLERWDFL